jgi:hypothetical protein
MTEIMTTPRLRQALAGEQHRQGELVLPRQFRAERRQPPPARDRVFLKVQLARGGASGSAEKEETEGGELSRGQVGRWVRFAVGAGRGGR